MSLIRLSYRATLCSSIFRLSLWLMILSGAAIPVFSQGISASPSRLFFTGNPGSRVTQVLSVANPSKKYISYRLFLKDFYRDSLGEKIYLDPGTTSGSNAMWVERLPATIDLAPDEKKDIPVYLNIPADTMASQRGVSHSMLFLSQVGNADTVVGHHGSRNMGIQVRLEMAVHIYYTPATAIHRELAFLAFDERGLVVSGKDTLRRFAVRVLNKGDICSDATLRVEFTDKGNGREIPIPEKRISLLPGTEQIVYIDLPAVRGRYLAVAFLDTGDQNDLKVAEKDIVY